MAKITKPPILERSDHVVMSKVINAGVKITIETKNKGHSYFVRVEYDNGDFQDGKKAFSRNHKTHKKQKVLSIDPAIWHEVKRVYELVYEEIIKHKFGKK